MGGGAGKGKPAEARSTGDSEAADVEEVDDDNGIVSNSFESVRRAKCVDSRPTKAQNMRTRNVQLRKTPTHALK